MTVRSVWSSLMWYSQTSFKQLPSGQRTFQLDSQTPLTLDTESRIRVFTFQVLMAVWFTLLKENLKQGVQALKVCSFSSQVIVNSFEGQD